MKAYEARNSNLSPKDKLQNQSKGVRHDVFYGS